MLLFCLFVIFGGFCFYFLVGVVFVGFLDLLKNLPFKKIIQMFSGQCMRKYNILSDRYIYFFNCNICISFFYF